jgi:hypothetical protein
VKKRKQFVKKRLVNLKIQKKMKKMFKPKVMLKSNVEAYILDVRNSKSSLFATEKKIHLITFGSH